MKTIKGPGIFLAQFAGDQAPYNTLEGMAGGRRGTVMLASRFRVGIAGCSILSVPQRARPIATK